MRELPPVASRPSSQKHPLKAFQGEAGTAPGPPLWADQARNAGWTLREPSIRLERGVSTGHSAMLSTAGSQSSMAFDFDALPFFDDEPHQAVATLSDVMAQQLHQLTAHMERVIVRERVRHSSDLSLLLRRVDKDLEETFRSVRETFVALTGKVKVLMNEVETNRKQMAGIQAKFQEIQYAAEVRAQYVYELEAALDAQSPDAGETVRKLSAEVVKLRKMLAKAKEESLDKQRVLQEELRASQAQTKRLEDERDVTVHGMQPPLLPEMAPSWTRRMRPGVKGALMPPSPAAQLPPRLVAPHGDSSSTAAPASGDGLSEVGSPSAGSEAVGVDSTNTAVLVAGASTWPREGADLVGSVMALTDATRAVPRSKVARDAHGRALSRGRQSATTARESGEVAADLRRRIHLTEKELVRKHKLTMLAAPALQLLKDVFAELRLHWRLLPFSPSHKQDQDDPMKRHESPTFSEASEAAATECGSLKAAELLDRIVQLFFATVPTLGGFPELLNSLAEEASRPLSDVLHVSSAWQSSNA